MFSSIVVALTEGMTIAIVVQAILSWFPGVRALAPVKKILHYVTRPVLDPIRQRLPIVAGLDLSPWVAVLLIVAAQTLLLGLLAGH